MPSGSTFFTVFNILASIFRRKTSAIFGKFQAKMEPINIFYFFIIYKEPTKFYKIIQNSKPFFIQCFIGKNNFFLSKYSTICKILKIGKVSKKKVDSEFPPIIYSKQL